MREKKDPGADVTSARAKKSRKLFKTIDSKATAAPFQALYDVTSKAVERLRRQRAAHHLHALGPRPTLEALLEIAAGGGLDDVLARYGRLDPATVSPARNSNHLKTQEKHDDNNI